MAASSTCLRPSVPLDNLPRHGPTTTCHVYPRNSRSHRYQFIWLGIHLVTADRGMKDSEISPQMHFPRQLFYLVAPAAFHIIPLGVGHMARLQWA